MNNDDYSYSEILHLGFIGVGVKLWTIHNKKIHQLSLWMLICAISSTGCAQE